MIGESFDPDTRYALTNLVGCIPKEESTKGEPTLQAIKACREKLLEVIGLAKPKAIVCVGTLSKRHTPVVEGVTQVALLHPAAILRMDVSQQGLAYQRCIVILRDVSEFVTVEGD
jgi:uracil-DNA glycosylase